MSMMQIVSMLAEVSTLSTMQAVRLRKQLLMCIANESGDCCILTEKLVGIYFQIKESTCHYGNPRKLCSKCNCRYTKTRALTQSIPHRRPVSYCKQSKCSTMKDYIKILKHSTLKGYGKSACNTKVSKIKPSYKQLHLEHNFLGLPSRSP